MEIIICFFEIMMQFAVTFAKFVIGLSVASLFSIMIGVIIKEIFNE